MRKSALFCLLTVVLVHFAFGQSAEDTNTYSESTSNKERPELKFSNGVRKDFEKRKKQILGQKKKLDGNDEETIKIDSTLVIIPVTVYDRHGNYGSDLKQENFRIFEDGEEQEIEYFGTNDKPTYVALLIDTSPSTKYKREEIKNAAKTFVSKLKPEDQVMVIYFNRTYKVTTEFTNNRQKINRAIDEIRFSGNTVVYETIGFTVNEKLSKIDGRKAIVLFTDGVDTLSVSIRHDDSLYYSQESGATFFPVYYNTYRPNMAGILGFLVKGDTLKEYETGRKYVEQLAERTGGKVTDSGADSADLTKAFESIAEELHRQYFIGYYPKKDGEIGDERRIKVRINRPNLAIRARDSYIIGGNLKPSREK